MSDHPAPGRARLTRFARRGSLRLAYEITAPTTIGSQVVLLHEVLDARITLAPLRDQLVAAGNQVILPDIRGHGASAGLSGRHSGVIDFAADLDAILDTEHIARVHLVGQGVGGAIALTLTHAAPLRVQSCSLIAPPVLLLPADGSDARAGRAVAAARALVQKIVDAADRGLQDQSLALWGQTRWGDAWRDRLPPARLAAMRRHLGALAPLLRAVATTTITSDTWREVTKPTLVQPTSLGFGVDAVMAEHLMSLLPDGRVTTHSAAVDAPDGWSGESGRRLIEAVVAFIAETEQRADRR